MLILFIGIATIVSVNYYSYYRRTITNPKYISLIGWRIK